MNRLDRILKTFLLIIASAVMLSFGAVGVKAYTPPVSGMEEVIGDAELSALHADLLEQFKNCASVIDVSAYRIPKSAMSTFQRYVYYCFPEAFHVRSGMSYSYGSEYVSYIRPSYLDSIGTRDAYEEAAVLFYKNANELLRGVKDNPSLSDESKALILHDRLIEATAYDYDNYLNHSIPRESYTAYGVMVLHTGVCQGYSLAYSYLLSVCGIRNTYVSSDSLGHAWNIVWLDGVPYHVDTAWDDPVPDKPGQVLHKIFLRSTEGIRSTGHEVNGTIDYNDLPADTRYDDAFWLNIRAPFVLAGGSLYYLQNDAPTGRIIKIDGASATECHAFTDYWKAGSSSYWIGVFSGFSTDGDVLFYNDSKALYAYDPIKNETRKLYEPDLSFSDTASIYGFTYTEGTFTLMLNSTPNGTDGAVTVTFVPKTVTAVGDFDRDGRVDAEDATYLLYHILFPEAYPILQSADLDGNEAVGTEDVVYLLYHLAFPDFYPLHITDDHSTEEDVFE